MLTEIYIQIFTKIVYQNLYNHQTHKFLVFIHRHVIGYFFDIGFEIYLSCKNVKNIWQ